MSNQRLTKLEAEAIWSAAGNMQDDMADYYSFMTPAKLKAFLAAYASGMEKLRDIMSKQNKKNGKGI